MQLSPSYDGAPILSIEGADADQREPLVRQRRRMQAMLEELTDEQWSTPSRCEGWTTQDVVAHLVGVNHFWVASITAGAAGQPTRFLAVFDPVATPAQLIEPMRKLTPAETLEQFVVSNESMIGCIESLDDAAWSALAESPVGHLSIRLVAHHALWDSWVHERDVMLPLGLTSAEEPDELISCLRYVAALGPVFACMTQPDRHGSLLVEATEPACRLVVDVGATVAVHGDVASPEAVRLAGRCVDLVESLSIRTPFGQAVPEESRWLLGGLAEVFDTTLDLI